MEKIDIRKKHLKTKRETPSTEGGLNLNLGIAYDITKKIFAQVQYDFSSISAPNDIPDTSFNTQIQLLKIGVGYRF
ncbi:hypothetical protein [uncultured Aquimarina sp.]|uniref:outer membrane protein n=1 Tax=uncultured Aquimarina sp. TaxID=575652 RepID=UPI00262AEDEC|nr:hypothetical protein [uncultured Aquimarina sp.]